MFSCISRKLNYNHAFSADKMRELCKQAYSTIPIEEQRVVSNNLDWDKYFENITVDNKHLIGIKKTKVC